MIRTVNRDELTGIAKGLVAPVIEEFRAELDAVKLEQKRLRETAIATNTQLVAVDNRIRTEHARSEKSREAILKRLAEVENAARVIC